MGNGETKTSLKNLKNQGSIFNLSTVKLTDETEFLDND